MGVSELLGLRRRRPQNLYVVEWPGIALREVVAMSTGVRTCNKRKKNLLPEAVPFSKASTGSGTKNEVENRPGP